MTVIIKLKSARLSFPDLWIPTQFQGSGPASYKAVFLQPKDALVKVKQTNGAWADMTMDEAINAVAVDKWGKKAATVLNAVSGSKKEFCWIDGAKSAYDGYEGNWALSAGRPEEKGAPDVRDWDKSVLGKGSGKPYGGCFVDGIVDIWAQDNKFGKGIRATLVGVQFIKDGESFGGGSYKAQDDDFDELEAPPETENDLF